MPAATRPWRRNCCASRKARPATPQRYTHITDGRFKGGHITRHYGAPARGIHAVQLEMTQCSYMQEALPFAYLPERAAQVQPHLRRMLEAVLGFARSKAA